MNKTVTIYTSPICHFCHLLKDWLADNKIKFVEKDVSLSDEARNELLKKSNQLGVPVTVIKDLKTGKETVVIGFVQERIEKALK